MNNFLILKKSVTFAPNWINMVESLAYLFRQTTGVAPEQIVPLSAAGSNRKYFRLQGGGQSLIGVEGTSKEENEAFIYMAQHFHQLNLPVPKLLTVADDKMSYLQEDLGDMLLFDYISNGRETGNFSEEEKQVLRLTIRQLAKFQIVGATNFDFNVCYPQAEFNHRSVSWDLNYFKYCFLKATGIEFQEDKLEDDFERLSLLLLSQKTSAFLYRDFQSRNVMLISRDQQLQPVFIDFQGGRKGPLQYDVASFLWQAKANFPQPLREELIEEYLDEVNKYIAVDKEEFKRSLLYFVLFRTLQVLGAYGYRGYFERKPHFLQSIPFAIRNLKELLTKVNPTDFTYLYNVLTELCALPQFQPQAKQNHLTVTVYSFSFKKGIPADNSGNGGGFVFDCRALNNPGRYKQYANLTGTDEAVINFIEDDGGMFQFLDNAYSLVDASVKQYLERGFTNLMISYGCTGGQHRSVYAAQKTAEHINHTFGVEVKLIHRERNITTILQKK